MSSSETDATSATPLLASSIAVEADSVSTEKADDEKAVSEMAEGVEGVPGVGDVNDDVRQNPEDETLDAEERAKYTDPYWIGTLAITLTKGTDDFVVEIYSICTSYYKQKVLSLTAYQSAVFTFICDLPGQLEIVFLVMMVCVPILGLRGRYYLMLAKLIHIVTYYLLSQTALTYGNYLTYGFIAKFGSALSGATTDFYLVQRANLEPLHKQGYLMVSWSIVETIGTTLGTAFVYFVVDNKFNWISKTASAWFTTSRICMIYALYPIPIFPFYFLLSEQKAKEPAKLCQTMAKLERQIRAPEVAFALMLFTILELLSLSQGDTSMFELDACKMTEAQYTVLKFLKLIATLVAHFVFRTFFLNWDLRYMYVASYFTTLLLALLYLVPLYTWIGQHTLSCSAYIYSYELFGEAASAFSSNIKSLMLLTMCHSRRGPLLYCLVTTIIDISDKYSAIYSVEITARFNVTKAQLEAGDYGPYATYCLYLLPFAIAPVFFAPLIPRSRAAVRTLGLRMSRAKRDGMAMWWDWTQYPEKLWPAAMTRRLDLHSTSFLVITWWLMGLIYTYWKAVAVVYGDSGPVWALETHVWWGAVMPIGVLGIVSRCGGCCVEPPGAEQDPEDLYDENGEPVLEVSRPVSEEAAAGDVEASKAAALATEPEKTK